MLEHRRRMLPALAAALLSGCSPIRVVNALVPSGGYRRQSFGYGNDARQALDVYAPLDARNAAVVVFVYGGSWRSGRREDYHFVGQAFAALGVVAVIVDYRLHPQVRYPAFIEDCAAAVAWTHAHIGAHGGDANRIFLMGHSAGAYNAAMVALDPRWLAPHGLACEQLAGWIGLAGPYDFLPITGANLKPVFDWPNTPLDSQPIAHTGPRSPPTLLLAAENDDLVDPRINTDRLAQALRRAGADVTDKRYGNVDHYTLMGAIASPLRTWIDAPVLADIDGWLRRRVESAAKV